MKIRDKNLKGPEDINAQKTGMAIVPVTWLNTNVEL